MLIDELLEIIIKNFGGYMEDKVINVEEIPHQVTLNLKNGKKIITDAITINTYYESGRKDCAVKINKPLDLMGKSEK